MMVFLRQVMGMSGGRGAGQVFVAAVVAGDFMMLGHWGERYEPDVYSDGSAADEPLQKLLAANAAGGDPEMLRQVRSIASQRLMNCFFATLSKLIFNRVAVCSHGRFEKALVFFAVQLAIQHEPSSFSNRFCQRQSPVGT